MLPTRAANPPLKQDISADIAIIGAGYTGLAAAKRWRELAPDDVISIVEASEIGEGNPGRNSGFLLEISLANDADPKQLAKMKNCNSLLAKTLEKIVAEVTDASLDCQLKRVGTYRAAAGQQGIKSLAQYRAFLEAADLPFQALNRKELNERLGTRFYQQGLYSPHCFLAQPAALIRNLAEQLPNGIELYENTAVLSLRESNSRWLIETPEGNITANKVIVANNAFAKSLGIGKSQLVAMYTYAGITPVLGNSDLENLGSDKNWGLLPTHRLGSTLRRTEDGRLLVRCLYSYEREMQPQQIEKELALNLGKRFPQLNSVAFEHIWGGAVGFTFNGGTVFGEVKPGMYVSAGCNGGGVIKGSLFGELLANLAHGQNVPDVPQLFGTASWMPPEPVRALGFQIVSRLERYRGRAEI